MVRQPSKLRNFVAELRRRHVIRVALTYAAGAFVVLQLGEIILPAFSAEWALRYLVVFAVLGFPLITVLAWVFDITPEGIRKTQTVDPTIAGAATRPGANLLPRVALLTITVLAVGGLGWWWIDMGSQPAAPPRAATEGGPRVVPATYRPDEPIRSLAVLPLDNFSDAGEQDYFAAGMHEAIIARLSQLPTVRVVSRTSVARYSSSGKTIPEIARELRVEGIVEGSVMRVGSEVRITVQLIHGPSDTHVWSQSYTRDFADVLALQGEVAEAIAVEIQGELSPQDRATLSIAVAASTVPEATEEFMKARFEQSRETPEGLRAAMDHYSEAVLADPEFARAYAGMAGTELMLEMTDPSDPTASLERARLMALKALEVDPGLAEAHDILTLIDEHLRAELVGPALQPGRPQSAEARRAGERTGTDGQRGNGLGVVTLGSDARAEVGEMGTDSTRVFETESEVSRQVQAAWAGWAMRSAGERTLQPSRLIHAARQLQATGKTDDAIELLQRVYETDPGQEEAWEAVERIYASEDRYNEILDMRRMWVEDAGGDAESVARLEALMAEDGAFGYWVWRLEELEAREARGERVSPVDWAAAYVGTGARDKAFEMLNEAFRIRDRRLVSVRHDSLWDPLRGDPRFGSLVNRMRRQSFPPPRRSGS